jgi:hypothetical protein
MFTRARELGRLAGRGDHGCVCRRTHASSGRHQRLPVVGKGDRHAVRRRPLPGHERQIRRGVQLPIGTSGTSMAVGEPIG